MILIVVDSMERYAFLARLVKAVASEFAFMFATSEPLAHVLLKRAGFRSIYLRGTWRADTVQAGADGNEYHDAIEVLNGQIAGDRARRDAAAIVRAVERALRTHRVSRCVMWNGQQLVCRAVARACAAHHVPMKFLEISNLPNKLFVDRLGVNARSSIGRMPELIDALPMPSEREHDRWLAEYEAYKARPLPQARTLTSRKALSALNYVLKAATNGVAQNALRAIPGRKPPIVPACAKTPSAAELARRRYVFLPLQVSHDTQLKLHSAVDNRSAIRIAVRLAASARAELIVKPHPAERDAAMIDDLLRLRGRYRFDVATASTVDLVRHARAVVTINSTVGLEALLYGKPVVTLGRCFYASFDRARLLKYIHMFLVDGIDYFGAGDIPAAAARCVLAGD